MGFVLHTAGFTNLYRMKDITMKYSAKDWKVKVVKNFILQKVFCIIFLILFLLTKAILNTLGDKIEIQPPANYSVGELEMRSDALSHCPSSQLLLHLPMKRTKSSLRSSLSSSAWQTHATRVFRNLCTNIVEPQWQMSLPKIWETFLHTLF